MYFAANYGILPQNESPPQRVRLLGFPMPSGRRRTVTVYLTDKEYAGLEALRKDLGIKVSMSALAQFSLRTFLERYKNNHVQLLLDLNLRQASEPESSLDGGTIASRGGGDDK